MGRFAGLPIQKSPLREFQGLTVCIRDGQGPSIFKRQGQGQLI